MHFNARCSCKLRPFFSLNFARLRFITNFSQIVDSFIAHFLNHQIAVWFQLENFRNASVSADRYALPDDAIFYSNTNSCTAFFSRNGFYD